MTEQAFTLVSRSTSRVIRTAPASRPVAGLDGFVSLAAGYGCAAERVADQALLPTVLRRGLALHQPYLIAVNIDASVPELI
jgi:thiamine pyrophosphate-dependent acetolactate synthase large subunit-like protein